MRLLALCLTLQFLFLFPLVGCGRSSNNTPQSDPVVEDTAPDTSETTSVTEPPPQTEDKKPEEDPPTEEKPAAPREKPREFEIAVNLSDDGQRVVYGNSEGSAGVFNLSTGDPLKVIRGSEEAPVSAVASNRSGSRIAIGTKQGTVKVVDLSAATQADGLVSVFDKKSKKKQEYNPGFHAHTSAITALAFHPSGEKVATSDASGSVRIWPLGERKSLRLTGHTSTVRVVATSEDGSVIVSGSDDRTIRIWDPSQERMLRTLEGHKAAITAIAIGTKYIASGDASGEIRVWDVRSRGNTQIQPAAHEGPVTGLLFDESLFASAPTKLISSGEDGSIRSWTIPFKTPRAISTGTQFAAKAIALSKQRDLLAAITTAEQIDIIDIEKGTKKKTIKHRPNSFNSVAFSHDNKLVVTGNALGHVYFWDQERTNQIALFPAHSGGVSKLLASHIDSTMASVGVDGKVAIWSVPKLPRLLSDRVNGIEKIAQSGSREFILYGLSNGSLGTFNFDADSQVTVASDAKQPVSSVAVGSELSSWSVGYRDGQIHVWDFAKSPKSPVAKFAAHNGSVTGVAIDDGAKRMWSTGANGQLKAWKLPRVKESNLLASTSPADVVAASIDGALIVCGGQSKELHFIDRVNSPTKVAKYPLKSEPTCIAISKGTVAIGLADGSVQLRKSDDHSETGAQPASGTPVQDIALSPNGSELAVVRANKIEIVALPLSSESKPQIVNGSFRQVTYTSDGSKLIAGGKELKVIDSSNPSNVQSLAESQGDVTSLGLSPVNQFLVVGYSDGTVRLWKAEGSDTKNWIPSPVKLVEAKDAIKSVCFNNRGDQLCFLNQGVARSYSLPSLKLRESFAFPGVAVNAVALISDGEKVVTACEDGTVRLADSHLLSVKEAHSTRIRHFVVSADRKHLVTTGQTSLRIWSNAAKLVKEYTFGTATVSDVDVSADGSKIAALLVSADGRHGLCRLWNNGKQIDIRLAAVGMGIQFSPDGSTVAVGDGQRVNVYGTDSGSFAFIIQPEYPFEKFGFSSPSSIFYTSSSGQLLEHPFPTIERSFNAHDSKIHDVAFVGNNSIATTSEDRRVRIWKMDGTMVGEFASSIGEITSLSFDSGSNQLVGAGRGTKLAVFELAPEGKMKTVDDRNRLDRFALSPTGRRVATSSENHRVIRILDLRNGKEIQRFAQQSAVSDLRFLTENEVLVSQNLEPTLRVLPLSSNWTVDAETKLPVLRTKTELVSVGENQVRYWSFDGAEVGGRSFEIPNQSWTHAAIRHDGSQLAVGGRRYVAVYNTRNNSQQCAIETPADVTGLAFNSTGSSLAVSNLNDRVTIYNVSDGKFIQEVATELGIDAVAFSSDDRSIIVGHSDSYIRTYELPLETTIDNAHRDEVVALEFIQDQHLITAGKDGVVQLWDLSSPQRPVARYTGGDGPVRSLGVSIASEIVAASFEDDEYKVCLWPLIPQTTTREIGPTKVFAHSSMVRSLRLSTDGRLLAVGCDDNMSRIWDVTSEKQLANFTGQQEPIVSVGFTSAMDSLIAVSADLGAGSWSLPNTSDPLGGDSVAVARTTAFPQLELNPQVEVVEKTLTLEDQLENMRNLLRTASTTDERETYRKRVFEGQKQLLTRLAANSGDPNIVARANRIRGMREVDNTKFVTLRQKRRLIGQDGWSIAKERELLQLRKQAGEEASAAAKAVEKPGIELSADHPNLVQKLTTEYPFAQGRTLPIYLAVSSADDAQTVVAIQPRVINQNDNSEIKGRVDVWDTPSNYLINSWDELPSWGVKRVDFVPDESFAYTSPINYVFPNNVTKSARYHGPSLCVSEYEPPLTAFDPSKFQLAFGRTGELSKKSPILDIFKMNRNDSRVFMPAHEPFLAYESIVQAIAYSPTENPYVAFCVRGRSSHKLILADANNFSVDRMVVIEEAAQPAPWNTAPQYGIKSLAFAGPKTDHLVAHGLYDGKFRLKIWKIKWHENNTGQPYQPPELSEYIVTENAQPLCHAVRGVSDSVYFAMIRQGQVTVRPLHEREGKNRYEINTAGSKFAFSDDGNFLAVGDRQGNVQLWNLVTGKNVPLIEATEHKAHSGPIVGIAFAKPDPLETKNHRYRYLVTASEDNTIKIWNVAVRLY